MGYTKLDIGKTDWIIDSGTSRHLTARCELLEDYISILPKSITIGNVDEISAIGQGNLTLQTASGIISLSGVLYLPDIGSNLISVAMIVDQGFQVEFTRSGYTGSKRNRERVIVSPEENICLVRGLLEIALAGQARQKDNTTRDIGHQRIAYRSLNQQAIIQRAKSVTSFSLADPGLNNDDEELCRVCAEGKPSREYLTGERSKGKQLLHTIHSYVCGPIATPGLMGEHYFSIFINECLGRMDLSLLTERSEVFERFK